jgi:hypothetical protein
MNSLLSINSLVINVNVFVFGNQRLSIQKHQFILVVVENRYLLPWKNHRYFTSYGPMGFNHSFAVIKFSVINVDDETQNIWKKLFSNMSQFELLKFYDYLVSARFEMDSRLGFIYMLLREELTKRGIVTIYACEKDNKIKEIF